MFAEDTKLFSAIKCQSDAVLLQNDLRHLEHWSSIYIGSDVQWIEV
jgi:hypothetical protein